MDLEAPSPRPTPMTRSSYPTHFISSDTLIQFMASNMSAYLFTVSLLLFIVFTKSLSSSFLFIVIVMGIFATTMRIYTLINHQRLQRMHVRSWRHFSTSLIPLNLQLTLVDRDFGESDYEMLLALDRDNPNINGASFEQIQRLPVHQIAQQSDNKTSEKSICSICLENVGAGDIVRTLPCMHQYHANCVDPWLVSNATCPICKSKVT